MKIANRPLLAPGFHELSQADLPAIFLDPVPGSRRRSALLAGLMDFLNDLVATNVKCEVWIDGSFATDKPEPNDLDLLAVWDPAMRSKSRVDELEKFDKLLDTPLSRARYQCDVYGAEITDIGMMAYWRGWYGFMRDGRTPKGIGVISI